MTLWNVSSTVRLFLQRWILCSIQEQHVQLHIQNYKQKLVETQLIQHWIKLLIPTAVCTNVAETETYRTEHSTLPTHIPKLTLETNPHTFRKDCT